MPDLALPGVAGICMGLVCGRRVVGLAGVVDVDLVGEERPNGLRTGMDEEELDKLLGVSNLRWYGEGVVRLRGLKLCPMIVSFRLVLEFQRGLLFGFSDVAVSRAGRTGV